MSAKFTAGKWVADFTDPANIEVVRADAVFRETALVASIFRMGNEGKTNAHLIAAAPDLYAALEAVVADLYPWMPHKDVGETAYNAAVAALAKARGEV
jgi:hypothetical protein